MVNRSALIFFLCTLVFVLFFLTQSSSTSVISVAPVMAESQAEIEQQKAEKQKQLDSVVAEINAILSSRSSLSQKIKDLQAEKKKMEDIIAGMKSDLAKSESLAKEQDTELNKVSQQYALNQ